MVKTYARTINISADPAAQSAFREQLKSVWPEVLQALQSIGVLTCKYFLMGNRLFAYFECVDEFDPATGFDEWPLSNERCVEWMQLMQDFEEPVPEANQAEGEWWMQMEEVFCFESQYEVQCCEPAHANARSYTNSYMFTE